MDSTPLPTSRSTRLIVAGACISLAVVLLGILLLRPQAASDSTSAAEPRASDPAPSSTPSHTSAPIPGARYTAPDRSPRSDDHRLASLFEAMYRIDAPSEQGRVSIVEIGDSHTAGDAFSAQMRRHLEETLGAAGRGYAHPGSPWEGFRQEQMSYDMSGGWTPVLAAETGTSGPFGVGGVRLESASPGAWLTRGVREDCPFDAPFESIAIHFLRHASGGRFRVSVDGEAIETVDTEGKRGLGVYRTSVNEGKTLRIEVLDGGRVELFGTRTFRRGEGVEYASLGLNGADVSDFASIDSGFVEAQLTHLDPDLLIFGFGTNGAYNLARFAREAGANDTLVRRRFERYRRQFRAIVDRHVRAAPEASCLVMLPPDLAPANGSACRSGHGNGCTPKRPGAFEQVVSIQRRVADRLGCAVWNRAEAMGGEASIHLWADRRPALARDDGIHLTIEGYQRLAGGLFQDLTRTYLAWKRGRGPEHLQTTPVLPSLRGASLHPTAQSTQ